VHFAIDEGSGTAILFLPGLQMMAGAFAPMCERLIRRRRVLVPEMPGYGASPAMAGLYDFGAVNDILEADLSARGVRELAGVVGFSAGAYRALLLALDGRTPIERLAILGGTAGPSPEERATFAQMAERYRPEPIGPDLVAMVKEWGLSPAFRTHHPKRATEIDAWLAASITS
jgi:3-oxoadipate enol-lactonase